MNAQTLWIIASALWISTVVEAVIGLTSPRLSFFLPVAIAEGIVALIVTVLAIRK